MEPARMPASRPAAVLATLATLAPAAFAVRADTFCVETAAQLQAALDQAGDNVRDDEIRLSQGVYSRDNGFSVTLADGKSLEISGGWRRRHGNPCAIQDGDPWLSRIDGLLVSRGLDVSLASDGFLAIADLTIQRGATVVTRGLDDNGAGLRILGILGNQAQVAIERVAFVANTATGNGGGLYYSSGPGSGLQIRNSLFLGNLSAGSGGAGMLGGEGPKRVVGNTVVGNDSPGPVTDGFYVLGPGVLANNLMAQNGDRDLFLGPPGGQLLLHNNVQVRAGLEPDPASTGNSEVDPMLAGGCANPRLLPGSPLVDAGAVPTPADGWLLGSTELDGHSRELGAGPDIGAFELETVFRDGFEGPLPCPAP